MSREVVIQRMGEFTDLLKKRKEEKANLEQQIAALSVNTQKPIALASNGSLRLTQKQFDALPENHSINTLPLEINRLETSINNRSFFQRVSSHFSPDTQQIKLFQDFAEQANIVARKKQIEKLKNERDCVDCQIDKVTSELQEFILRYADVIDEAKKQAEANTENNTEENKNRRRSVTERKQSIIQLGNGPLTTSFIETATGQAPTVPLQNQEKENKPESKQSKTTQVKSYLPKKPAVVEPLIKKEYHVNLSKWYQPAKVNLFSIEEKYRDIESIQILWGEKSLLLNRFNVEKFLNSVSIEYNELQDNHRNCFATFFLKPKNLFDKKEFLGIRKANEKIQILLDYMKKNPGCHTSIAFCRAFDRNVLLNEKAQEQQSQVTIS